MARCVQLAKNGLGTTYPNPMVGSVIVYNGKIIGEGWHRKAGEAHAEVIAINSVSNQDLLKESTIYVSLEPCSHFGKTPPCSDLIIAKGIKKIVIGTVDPFAQVAGKGIKKLLDAGCEVQVGVLEKLCQDLNKRFFTYHNNKRPYILLKWAESNDGFIAPDTIFRQEKQPFWITNPHTKICVHKWRSEEQSILVGTNTAQADDPELTTREWYGHSPTRVVLDRNLVIKTDSKLLDSSTPTVVITEQERIDSKNVTYHTMKFDTELPYKICDLLYSEDLQSVIIEGGTITLQHFIDNNLWDEARVFKGSTNFKKGLAAPKLTLYKESSVSKISGDILTYYYNQND